MKVIRSTCAVAMIASLTWLAIGTGIASNSIASAEVASCPDAGNWFDGYYSASSQSTWIGVSASITNPTEQVCDDDTTQNNYTTGVLGNFNAVWTMIDWSPPSGQGWLQSGYIRSYGTADKFFSQALLANSSIYDAFGSGWLSSYGQNHQYWQNYQIATLKMRSLVDSSIFLQYPQTDWNASGRAYWVPEANSESEYLSSDVPGTSSSPTAMTSIQYEANDGTGNFQSTALGPLTLTNSSGSGAGDCQLSDRWGESSSISSNQFNIWTALSGVNPNC